MKKNVYSMVSPQTGRAVPNQFIIKEGESTYFKSYETIIARIRKGAVTLDREKWDFSRTTLKYLGAFLNGENKNNIQEKINAGVYKLANLN